LRRERARINTILTEKFAFEATADNV
jgi:hypothetical protein